MNEEAETNESKIVEIELLTLVGERVLRNKVEECPSLVVR